MRELKWTALPVDQYLAGIDWAKQNGTLVCQPCVGEQIFVYETRKRIQFLRVLRDRAGHPMSAFMADYIL